MCVLQLHLFGPQGYLVVGSHDIARLALPCKWFSSWNLMLQLVRYWISNGSPTKSVLLHPFSATPLFSPSNSPLFYFHLISDSPPFIPVSPLFHSSSFSPCFNDMKNTHGHTEHQWWSWPNPCILEFSSTLYTSGSIKSTVMERLIYFIQYSIAQQQFTTYLGVPKYTILDNRIGKWGIDGRAGILKTISDLSRFLALVYTERNAFQQCFLSILIST